MITIVSGYWDLGSSKFDIETYRKWMTNSLKINAPYVFFTQKKNFSFIKSLRKSPIVFVEKEIKDFYFSKYNFNEEYLHEGHCPSVELGKIWLEKIKLVDEAVKLNPYETEWFAWIDSAVCTYRDIIPPIEKWPNNENLGKLKEDCLNYTLSNDANSKQDINILKNGEYMHKVTGTWIIHKNAVKNLLDLFLEYFEIVKKEFENGNMKYGVLSDQVVWTRIMLDKPELFNELGKGYGEILPILYKLSKK